MTLSLFSLHGVPLFGLALRQLLASRHALFWRMRRTSFALVLQCLFCFVAFAAEGAVVHVLGLCASDFIDNSMKIH